MGNARVILHDARCEVARYYGTGFSAIVQLFCRLRWGDYAEDEFTKYYAPQAISVEDLEHLEQAVAILCDHYLVSMEEARARLGKYRYVREQRTKETRQRGMGGCYFLFVQRTEATVPVFRKDIFVVLSRPRGWCLAQSVSTQEVVLCDMSEAKRGEACPIYRTRMAELKETSASHRKRRASR